KMRADRAMTEVEWVLSIGGIEVKTGVAIGTDIALEALERDFDAVFVGVGLGADSTLGVPGEQLAGVHGAVAWIEAMKLGRVELGAIRRAAVIGGGNTAIDVVREVVGLGIPHVEMIYRGAREGMSGYAHEWTAALAEGAHAEWRAVATALEGSGRVERVRCVRVDESKRPVEGSDFTVEADLVLLAIGQSKLGAMLAGLEGIRVEAGRIRTDAHGFTGRAKWYAGGDCTNGGKEVVNAAAEGKRAAHAMHAGLTGGRAHA
ncbi:MAG: FAD-dependent oxidoreductase, partial [Planctomycetaceae bacterium]|nr:FAD-dependent oxidoreductase [Planctomycetaceae bacterium]